MDPNSTTIPTMSGASDAAEAVLAKAVELIAKGRISQLAQYYMEICNAHEDLEKIRESEGRPKPTL